MKTLRITSVGMYGMSSPYKQSYLSSPTRYAGFYFARKGWCVITLLPCVLLHESVGIVRAGARSYRYTVLLKVPENVLKVLKSNETERKLTEKLLKSTENPQNIKTAQVQRSRTG